MPFAFAVVFATLVFLQPYAALSHGVRMIDICYVPIGVETYVPMTPANIDRSCVRVGRINAADKRYLELRSTLDAAQSGAFDDQAIRVKLTEPDQDVVYVDNTGGVSLGKRHLRLSASALAKVKRLIEEMTAAKTG